MPAPLVAILLENVLLLMLGDEALLCMPPPYVALLPQKMQLLMLGDEEELYMPPPEPLLTDVPLMLIVLLVLPLALPFSMVKPSSVAEPMVPELMSTW